MTRDPYTILGVNRYADESEIKKAYRRLAMKFHPDRNANLNAQEASQNNEKFKEVSEAYRILTDKNTNHSFPYNDFGNAFSDPSSYFEDMISSIFEKTYNKKTYNYHRKKENKDKTFKFQLNIIIDLKTALFGDSLLITEKIPFLCKECQGNGVITKKETKCRTCSGYGSVIGSFFGKNIKTDCPTCNGTGVGQEECKSCHGKGYQFKKEELIIDVPYGVQDLEEILVKNDNNRMIITGIINIKEHPLFIRQDNDLILNMSIPYTKALLGGDEDIVILSGEKISLKIPNNIKTGNMLRIKHKGGKNKLGRIGDLYIKFDVELPKKITKKERKILEKLIKEEKLENYTKSYEFRHKMKTFSKNDK